MWKRIEDKMLKFDFAGVGKSVEEKERRIILRRELRFYSRSFGGRVENGESCYCDLQYCR